jgi:hypothetical protein
MRPARSFKKSEKIVQPPGTKLQGIALSCRPAIPIPPSPPCLAGHPLGVVEFSATPIFFAPVERNSPRLCLFEKKLAPISINIENAFRLCAIRFMRHACTAAAHIACAAPQVDYSDET